MAKKDIGNYVITIIIVSSFMWMTYAILFQDTISKEKFREESKFCEEYGGVKDYEESILGGYVQCNKIKEQGRWFFGLLSYKKHYGITIEKDGDGLEDNLIYVMGFIVPFIAGGSIFWEYWNRKYVRKTKLKRGGE